MLESLSLTIFLSEQKFTEEIKILARKNTKLDEKIKLLQSKADIEKPQKRLASKGTITESQYNTGVSKEKILLQTEYLRRLNQPAYERVKQINFFVIFVLFCNDIRFQELENAQTQLAMREIEIDSLKEQLISQPQNKTNSCSHKSISVQSAMSRMEREADTLKSKIERMASDREDLKQNLKEVLDQLHNEQLSYTSQILGLTDQIKKLENDNRFLRDTQMTGTSSESKVKRMTQQIEEYVRELKESGLENQRLKTSYNQIR